MSAQPQSDIKIRALPEDEWWKVEETFAAGGDALKAGSTVVLVVEVLERIVAAVPVHELPVVGYMHVEERFRERGLGALLAAAVNNLFRPGESALTIIAHPAAAKLAEESGWVPVPGTLYRKDYS